MSNYSIEFRLFAVRCPGATESSGSDGDFNMTVLDHAWRCYAERCVPLNASDSERLQMRRAYYCGAQVLFTAMLKIVDEADEEFVSMDAIAAELAGFLTEVKAGRELKNVLKGSKLIADYPQAVEKIQWPRNDQMADRLAERDHEAEAILIGLRDPTDHAFVVVMGALLSLPCYSARIRLLKQIIERLNEQETERQ
jgi:hypothetical protein